LGDTDAVARISRAGGSVSEAVPPAVAEWEPRPSAVRGEEAREEFAGIFLLGAGFPSALNGTKDTLALPTITAALEQMEAAGGRMERRVVGDCWRYRGQPEPMLEMNQFKLTGLEVRPDGGEVVDSDLEGPVECDPTARICSSVVRGPVVIGPGAEIRDAFVGPYTSVGADARIEGAEVENSVILEGTSITHVGGRIDASVIGPHARIFRDFRIPRGMRINVGPGAAISLP
jgi:glucose-1-phosphate thymidylyltransferase